LFVVASPKENVIMVRTDTPVNEIPRGGQGHNVESAVWRELLEAPQTKAGSSSAIAQNPLISEPALLRLCSQPPTEGIGARTLDEQFYFVGCRPDDPQAELAKLRKDTDAALQKQKPDYAAAAKLLKQELELLKKMDPTEKDEAFIKPYARLGLCLRELSNGKGSKEADEFFAKALKLIDANPKTDEKEKREQEVYRALVLEGKGNNNRLLGISATTPKDREEFYTKAEKELTDSLKVLNEKDFKANPFRLRALANLSIVEDALGHKESSAKHIKELKEHPLYEKMRGDFETGLLRNAIEKAAEKSDTLKAIMKDMKEECPWGPLMSATIKLNSKESSYNSATSQIELGSDIPAEQMPQSYAYAATLGMRQGLFKLYSGDAPVDEATYKQVQLDRFAAAHFAEAKVAKELGQPCTFAGQDLTKLTEKEIADLVKDDRDFQDFCDAGYKVYSDPKDDFDNFTKNKKILTNGKFLKKGF
jgi:hypothetical protein